MTAIVDGPAPGPAPAQARNRVAWREVLIALSVAVTLAALGLPIGLLWRAVSPKVEFVMTEAGATTVQTEPEGFVAGDGWYVLITFVAGVVAAVVVWNLLRRRRGPLIMLGLVLGCIAGGVLTAWIGHQIGYAHYRSLATHAAVGTHFFRPPSVRSGYVGLWFGFLPRVQGAVLVEAIAAATAYLVLAAFHVEPDLRRAEEQTGNGTAQAVSWEPMGWTAQPGSPAPPGSDPAGPPRD
jgi:hypothetical protein